MLISHIINNYWEGNRWEPLKHCGKILSIFDSGVSMWLQVVNVIKLTSSIKIKQHSRPFHANAHTMKIVSFLIKCLFTYCAPYLLSILLVQVIPYCLFLLMYFEAEALSLFLSPMTIACLQSPLHLRLLLSYCST